MAECVDCHHASVVGWPTGVGDGGAGVAGEVKDVTCARCVVCGPGYDLWKYGCSCVATCDFHGRVYNGPMDGWAGVWRLTLAFTIRKENASERLVMNCEGGTVASHGNGDVVHPGYWYVVYGGWNGLCVARVGNVCSYAGPVLCA